MFPYFSLLRDLSNTLYFNLQRNTLKKEVHLLYTFRTTQVSKRLQLLCTLTLLKCK